MFSLLFAALFAAVSFLTSPVHSNDGISGGGPTGGGPGGGVVPIVHSADGISGGGPTGGS